ncbi:MAG: repeat containing protein [Chthonomonadaceae bacterium]|nr:repeat containing protein [Chthonomonadaceae bacterium]
MKTTARFGSLALLVLATLSASRIPLAQGGSVPHLYIADGAWDSEDCRIVRLDDLTGKGWTNFGSKGSKEATEFGSVSDVAVDSKRRIYGVDQERNRVVRIDDMSGKGLIAFGKPGKQRGQFNYPCGICIDAQDRIYVTDTSAEMGPKANRVIRMDDMTGKNWQVFDLLEEPTGVSVDKDGRIYIANYAGSSITRIDSMDGKGVKEFGKEGSGKGEFSLPFRIALDAQNRIYVSDFGNHRIVRIDDMTGKNWTTFGTKGKGVNQLGSAGAIAFDRQGRIYLGDRANNRIIRIDDMTGKNWVAFAPSQKDPHHFFSVSGICVH